MANPLHFFQTILPGLVILWGMQSLTAQQCTTLNLMHQADIPASCNEISMTMEHDNFGRPYLYVAAKEGGLKIHNISDPALPQYVSGISTSEWGDLDLTNLSQQGNFLYLATGSHFAGGQEAGFAVVDVSDPMFPSVTDYWKHTEAGGGAGIVEVEGDYAYLGAMEDGLMIFDISDKQNISLVSQYIPDIYFPDTNPDPAKYNARGMRVKDDVVYLCYDAGGIRIINVSNKQLPVETGKYSNPTLDGLPRAYNNLILDDTLLYVAIDYCGMEVLNVKDTSNITQIGWWNPWHCETNPLNWFSSPGHTNEIEYVPENKQVFMSTGKSDMYVVSVADPSQPDSCDIYGGITNNIGTWGIEVYEDQIYLAYICSLIPFTSTWAGVKILTFDRNSTNIPKPELKSLKLYPNPADTELRIQLPDIHKEAQLEVHNSHGQLIYSKRVTME